jgi:hypothetical protein
VSIKSERTTIDASGSRGEEKAAASTAAASTTALHLVTSIVVRETLNLNKHRFAICRRRKSEKNWESENLERESEKVKEGNVKIKARVDS